MEKKTFTPYIIPTAPSLSPEQVRELAIRFSPFLSLPPSLSIVNLDWYLENSNLVYYKEEDILLDKTNYSKHLLFQSPSLNRQTLGNAEFEGISGRAESPQDKILLNFEIETDFSSLSPERVGDYYVSLVTAFNEEVGVPSPPPFVDLLFAFLLRSGNDIRWESFVLRIDTTLQVLNGINLHSHNNLDQKNLWFFSKNETEDELKSFECDPQTQRPIVYVLPNFEGMSNRPLVSSSNFLPKVEVVSLPQDHWVKFRGKWQKNQVVAPLLSGIFNRSPGGPSPIRIIPCPVRWVKYKDCKVGESIHFHDIRENSRSSAFFSLYSPQDFAWTVWDGLKTLRSEIQFSVLTGDDFHQFAIQDLKCGTQTCGDLSRTGSDKLYLGNFVGPDSLQGDEQLYVCIVEKEKQPRRDDMRSSFTLDPNKDEKTSSEAYIIRSDASELVLDVLGMGKEKKTPMVMSEFSANKLSQQWYFHCDQVKDGKMTGVFVNVMSDLALDVKFKFPHKGRIHQFPFKKGQKSQAIEYDTKTKRLTSKGTSFEIRNHKKMLGSEIYAMAPSESPAQKWRLEKVQTINVGTSPLEIIMTKNVEKVWDDEGSHARPVRASIWNPKPLPGWFSLGSIGQHGRNRFYSDAILVRQRDSYQGLPVLREPASFELVWTMDAWGAKPLYIWKPVTSSDYVALGLVATQTKRPPVGRESVKVVHRSLCSPSTVRFSDDGPAIRRGVPIWCALQAQARTKCELTMWEVGHIPTNKSSDHLPSVPLTLFTAEVSSGDYPLRTEGHQLKRTAFQNTQTKEKLFKGNFERVDEYKWRAFLPAGSMVRSCFLTDPRKGGSGEREKGKGVEEFVVESVHWDEGQTLRLLKNWVFERLAVFDPYRSHLERRDFKVHGTTYLPVYHFSVRYSVSKEWMVLSSQKQSVFVPHHEVFPEERGCFYGCGGSLEEERRVFDMMESLNLFEEEEEESKKNGDQKKEQVESSSSFSFSDISKEDVKEIRAKFRSGCCLVGESKENIGSALSWETVWDEEIEEIATRNIISKLKEKEKEKENIYVQDIKYSICFETFSVKKYYFPVIKCSYEWNGVRPLLWIDGKSNRVFSTDHNKVLKLRVEEVQKNKDIFVAGILYGYELSAVDSHMNYHPNMQYLILPRPKKTFGHISLKNHGNSSVILQSVSRVDGAALGPPLHLPAGDDHASRFQYLSRDAAIAICGGNPGQLELTGLGSFANVLEERRNYQNMLCLADKE